MVHHSRGANNIKNSRPSLFILPVEQTKYSSFVIWGKDTFTYKTGKICSITRNIKNTPRSFPRTSVSNLHRHYINILKYVWAYMRVNVHTRLSSSSSSAFPHDPGSCSVVTRYVDSGPQYLSSNPGSTTYDLKNVT